MPNLYRFFRPHHVDETRRPHESNAAYLTRLVHISSHRTDHPYLTLRIAERAYLDLTTALMARTIAEVTETHGSGRLLRYSERLVAAAAVHAASLIRHRPVPMYRIALANRLGAELDDVYYDLTREVDRLEGEERREIFGDLEDHGRVWREGGWEERWEER